MKTILLASLGCVVLSATASFAVLTFLSEGEARAPEILVDDVARLGREVAALRDGQGALRAGVDALGTRIDELSRVIRRASETVAVARNADAEGGEADAVDDGAIAVALAAADAEAPVDSAAVDLDASIDVLVDPTVSDGEKMRVWNALREAKMVDDAVAFFERRAEENPLDPDAHAELGGAYIQKLLDVGDVEKGRWAMKADRAFDGALELDPRHWDARFSKAVSYSFAPPVFGLQARAIEQFEILRAQQEEQSTEPRFAQTYLLLGNLYANQGKSENAREIWQRGAELYPDEDDFREVLGER